MREGAPRSSRGGEALRFGRRARLGGTLALVAGLAGMAVPAAAAARPAARALSPLATGERFYAGKTITFVDPSAPGGGIDTSIRILAPYLAQFLHATVNVENVVGADATEGENVAASAPPDGLTIGYLDTLNVVERVVTNTPGFAFSPSHLEFIGAAQTEATYAWVESNGTSCPLARTWEQLLQDGSAGAPVPAITETTGTTTTLAKFALAAFANHVTLRNAYASEAQLLQGFVRGDACVVTAGANKLAPYIAGGQAHPLALTAQSPAANVAQFAGTPTFAQLVKKDAKLIVTRREKAAARALVEFASGVPGFEFTGRGVPADRVLALQAAMKWAADSASFKATLTASGTTPGYTSGPAAQESFKKAVHDASPFVSLL